MLNRQYENCNYLQYFEPEIAPFINDEWLDKCYNLDYLFWTKKINGRDKYINNEKKDQNDTEKLIDDEEELTVDDFDDDNTYKPTKPINIQNYIDDDEKKLTNHPLNSKIAQMKKKIKKREKKKNYTDDDDEKIKLTNIDQNDTEKEGEEGEEKFIELRKIGV